MFVQLPVIPPVYATVGALPTNAAAGAVAIVLSSPPSLYIFDGTTWDLSGGGGVGLLDSINVWTALNTFTGGLRTTTAPTNANDVINLTYFQAYLNGIYLPAVSTYADTNITLSGYQTINGVDLSTAVNKGILLTNQSDTLQNGVWTADAGAWSRRLDCALGTDQAGTYVPILLGTGANNIWQQNSSPAIVGADPLDYTLYSYGGIIQTDNQGLLITGNILSLVLDGTTLQKSSSGLKVNPNLALTTLGVGTTAANTIFQLLGAMSTKSALGNTDARPAVSTTPIQAEIHGYSKDGFALNDGFLRLSAGGGSATTSQSWIDISGFSTVTDMNKNIVFGVGGSQIARITATGLGIFDTAPGGALSVVGGAQIGFSGGTVPPTNGLSVNGQAAFGTSTVNSVSGVTISVTSAFQLIATGTSTTVSSTSQAGIFSNPTLAPAAGSTYSSAFRADAIFSIPTSQTATNASAYRASLTTTANLGTITNLNGFLYDGLGSIVGTVTNAYGGYFNSPPSGTVTANLALYAANLSVGYSSANLNGTNNALFAGLVAIGRSTVVANTRLRVEAASTDLTAISSAGTNNTSGGLHSGISITTTFQPTTGSTRSVGTISNPTFIAPSAQTIAAAYSYQSSIVASSNVGTITNLIGFYSSWSGSLAGTVTNAYGGYFDSPPSGTVTANQALYTANLSVGYSTISLNGTANAAISGLVSLGTSTISYPLTITGTAVSKVLFITGSNGSSSFASQKTIDIANTMSCTGTGASNVITLSTSVTVSNTGGIASDIVGIDSNPILTGSQSGSVTNFYAIAGEITRTVTGNSYTPVSLTSSGTTYTITLGVSTPFIANQWVTISGVTPSAYNGTYQVASPSGSTFTVTGTTSDPAAASVVGTVTLVPVANAYSGWFSVPTLTTAVSKTALYTQNLSVGYLATTPPTSGMIVSGSSAFGVSSVNSSAKVTIQATSAYHMILNGTSTSLASSDQASVYVNSTFTPGSTSNYSSGFWSKPIFAAAGGITVGLGAAFRAGGLTTGNAGTVGSLIGFYYDGQNSIVGTVTRAFGAYFNAPVAAAASSTQALYADNLSIGYPTSDLFGTNYAIFSSQVAIGIDSPKPSTHLTIDIALGFGQYLFGTTTANYGGDQLGYYMAPVFNPTGGSGNSVAFYSKPSFNSPSAQTITNASAFHAAPTAASNVATITKLTGFYYDGSGSIAGTVTSIYGAYFADVPSGATNAMAMYSENGSFGYPSVSLRGTNNVLVKGGLSVGISTQTATVGTIITAPPASSTVTTAFGASLTLGTPIRNTTGYDIIVNLVLSVTVATAATVVMGVSSSATPTTNTAISTFSITGDFTLVAYIPNNYYLLVDKTGTLTSTNTIVAMAV